MLELTFPGEHEFMTARQVRSLVVGYCARLLFLAICCGLVGGGIEGFRASGQNFNVPERVRALEVQSTEQSLEVIRLRVAYDALNDSVQEMHGIGIAVGGALGILQIISMIAAYLKPKP